MKFQFKVKTGDFQSSRSVDNKGFLTCTGVKMSMAEQVLEYATWEFSGLRDAGFTGDVIRIYFPKEELLKPDTVASFEGKDVTDRHPDGNEVNAVTWADYAAGTVSNVRADGNFLTGDFLIKDAKTITKIQSNSAKEVSIGYTATLELQNGVTPDGKSYDGIWRGIVGDHVAVVEYGRAGAEVSIGDEKQGDMMKITINGMPFEVADNATLLAASEAQNAELENLRSQSIKIGDSAFKASELQAAQAVCDAQAKEIEELTAKVEDLESKQVNEAELDSLVAERSAVVGDAKAILPTVVTDGKTNLDIIKQVVAANSDNPIVKAAIGDGVTDENAVTAFKVLKASKTLNVGDTSKANELLNKTNTGDAKPVLSRAEQKAQAWKGGK